MNVLIRCVPLGLGTTLQHDKEGEEAFLRGDASFR